MIGAIFDMDGLLIDSESVYHAVWKEIALENGIQLDPIFLKKISGAAHDIACKLIEEYYQVEDGRVILEECYRRVDVRLSKHVELKKGVLELLKYFKDRQIKIGVASSTSKDKIIRYLTQVHIIDYFDAITSGMEVEHGKPAPDVFLLAAKRLRIDPKDCYVLEDGLNGIEAGYAAGCKTIMVPDMTQPTDRILSIVDVVCKDLLEVKSGIQDGKL